MCSRSHCVALGSWSLTHLITPHLISPTHSILLQQERISGRYGPLCYNGQPCPIISFLIFRDGDGGSPRGSTLFPLFSRWWASGDGWAEPHPEAEKMKLSLGNVTKPLWGITRASLPALAHITCTQSAAACRWNQCVALLQSPLHFHTLNLAHWFPLWSWGLNVLLLALLDSFNVKEM